MRATTLKTSIVTLMVTGLLTVAGCRKKEPEPEPKPAPDTEQATATDNNIAEFVVADIEAIGGEASENSSLSNFRVSGDQRLMAAACATVSLDPNLKIVTVDFGSGCTGEDGRVRSGKLFFNYAGSATNANYYRNPGFRLDVSSQNYVVDNHQVNIVSKTIQNTTPLTIPTGTNPGTNLTWSITANVNIVKPNNGGTISWNCTRTKELVNTSDPNCYRGQSQHIIWTKAIIKLNGAASGTNAKSESYTSVATDLQRDFNCAPSVQHPHRHPFISGTLAYKPGNRPTRLIDFGAGTCDLSATVTINNVVYNITLP